jgi:predicted MFS family arabinose efflux permease
MLNIAWGIGAMIATMFSATALAPLLGSWRWVMLFFGVPCVILGVLWWTTREPDAVQLPETVAEKVPFKKALSHVVRMKEVWLIGLMTSCLWGASMGLIGYLPYYLRDIGWTPTSADSVITVFSGVNTIGVYPMVLLSDKIGSRKIIIFISVVAVVITQALIPLANTTGIWLLVIACGFLRSGGSALINVIIFEVKGVGSTYGGTATGLANTISMVGAFLAPPIGNSLAEINPGYPFYFWAALAAASLPMVFFIKNRTGQSKF